MRLSTVCVRCSVALMILALAMVLGSTSAFAGLSQGQQPTSSDTHLVEVSKSWSGMLLNNSVARARGRVYYQNQLQVIENDLRDMKREFYSGRYSRVRPMLLIMLGGVACGVHGLSFMLLDLLIVQSVSYYGAASPSGFLIVGSIMLVISLVSFISGGVWLGAVNRRRRRMVRYMRNATRKKQRLERYLGRSSGYYSQIQPNKQTTGLFALPAVSHSNASFSF